MIGYHKSTTTDAYMITLQLSTSLSVGRIRKLGSIKYGALKIVVRTYKGTAKEILEKETAVPPLRIRLEQILDFKLTRSSEFTMRILCLKY